MEQLQQENEKFFGDMLADWLNSRNGAALRFMRRAGEAPDLVYGDGQRELRLEVVGAYYDSDYARMLWSAARGAPGPTSTGLMIAPDEQLAREIKRQISKKCGMAYGPDCALLVTVRPYITTARDMERLIESLSLRIPDTSPFSAIYLAGVFPTGTDSAGGHYVWQLT